jgi:hypothetical protein
LRRLRSVLAIPRDRDLTAAQWTAIEGELDVLAHELEKPILEVARRWLPERTAAAREAARGALGELELRTSEAYAFFDTFMDVLTQRLSPELGLMLKGCDMLAADALERGHPALRLAGAPLVYCNRGFGAAIIRTGVLLSVAGRCPVPLIQVPYARLQEKYNLASLIHEVGHEAIVRLRIRMRLVHAMRRHLDGHTRREVRDRYARWTLELGPDFWAFGCCGAAQAATVRDVLAIPPAQAVADAFGVHPPVYLRTLMAYHWCRRTFGRGPWDDWEHEWRLAHRRQTLPPVVREAERLIARASDVFFEAPLGPLGGRPLVDLFDLDSLSPASLGARLRGSTTESSQFRALRPTTQLAVFRLLRDRSVVSERRLDRSMSQWLSDLAAVQCHRGES